jgi:hypothetical protein
MAARLHTSYVKLPSVPIFNHIQRSCLFHISVSLSLTIGFWYFKLCWCIWMNFECIWWAKEQTHNCHPDRPLPNPVLKVSALVSDDLLWDEEPRGHISKISQNGRTSIQKGWANMGTYGNTIWNCLILGLSGLPFWRLTANLLHEDQPNESQEQPMPAFCANRIQVLWCTLRRSWSLSRLNAEVEMWCDAASS